MSTVGVLASDQIGTRVRYTHQHDYAVWVPVNPSDNGCYIAHKDVLLLITDGESLTLVDKDAWEKHHKMLYYLSDEDIREIFFRVFDECRGLKDILHTINDMSSTDLSAWYDRILAPEIPF